MYASCANWFAPTHQHPASKFLLYYGDLGSTYNQFTEEAEGKKRCNDTDCRINPTVCAGPSWLGFSSVITNTHLQPRLKLLDMTQPWPPKMTEKGSECFRRQRKPKPASCCRPSTAKSKSKSKSLSYSKFLSHTDT